VLLVLVPKIIRGRKVCFFFANSLAEWVINGTTRHLFEEWHELQFKI
jgi:hypothetical protein